MKGRAQESLKLSTVPLHHLEAPHTPSHSLQNSMHLLWDLVLSPTPPLYCLQSIFQQFELSFVQAFLNVSFSDALMVPILSSFRSLHIYLPSNHCWKNPLLYEWNLNQLLLFLQNRNVPTWRLLSLDRIRCQQVSHLSSQRCLSEFLFGYLQTMAH